MNKGNLKPFTIKTTGEVITIPPVSMAAVTMQLRREMPEPKPPIITVNIGGVVTQERNPADPDYLKVYELWEQLLQVEATDRVLKRIALRQRLTDEQKTAVAEYREALTGEQLPKNDKLLWFYEFAIGSDDDIKDIILNAQGQADPQEEKIAATADSLKS